MDDLLVIIVIIIIIYLLLRYFFPNNFRRRGRGSLGGGFGQNGRSAKLRRQLLKRVDAGTAERLVKQAKLSNPGKPERWYLEKVLYDLTRGR